MIYSFYRFNKSRSQIKSTIGVTQDMLNMFETLRNFMQNVVTPMLRTQ